MGFFLWFVPGNLYHGDENFASMHGLNKEQLSSGISVETLIATVDRRDQPALAKGLHQAILTGLQCTLHYATIRQGTGRQLSLTGSCLRNDEDVPTFFCGFAVEEQGLRKADADSTFEAHCRAASSLAQAAGNALAVRYIRSALHTMTG